MNQNELSVVDGVGPLREVIQRQCDRFPNNPEIVSDLQNVYASLVALMDEKNSRRSVMAIAACLLNTQFKDTGYVYRCSPSGFVSQIKLQTAHMQQLMSAFLDC